jgi:hypothetical protein
VGQAATQPDSDRLKLIELIELIVGRMYWLMLSTVIPFVAVSRQASTVQYTRRSLASRRAMPSRHLAVAVAVAALSWHRAEPPS